MTAFVLSFRLVLTCYHMMLEWLWGAQCGTRQHGIWVGQLVGNIVWNHVFFFPLLSITNVLEIIYIVACNTHFSLLYIIPLL